MHLLNVARALKLLVLALTCPWSKANAVEYLESLHARGCSSQEVTCDGESPTELNVDVEKLRQRDPKLRDDAVVSSLMEWQHVPTLKLLKINGLKGKVHSAVPSELCKFTQLESLQLNGNGFKSVPACLAELKIKELFLGNNRLSALPAELGRMRLKKLALGSNRFHSFPMPILDLELMMQHNQLSEIPSGIQNLRKLRRLNLVSNKLESLPEELGKVKSLKVLQVDDNRLEYVPSSLKPIWRAGNRWQSDEPASRALMVVFVDWESELYTSLPKTRFGMTIFPDTRHVAEPSVPLCSHTMGDAERFKTTNNMYSIFSVPDHQNAQAADTMRKHATREYKVERIRARQRDFEERCWAANEAAQQYDEMKVARKAMNLLNYERRCHMACA
eukprot:symbB.v1.2.020040.t3/scaffold1665.1/size106850/1